MKHLFKFIILKMNTKYEAIGGNNPLCSVSLVSVCPQCSVTLSVLITSSVFTNTKMSCITSSEFSNTKCHVPHPLCTVTLSVM